MLKRRDVLTAAAALVLGIALGGGPSEAQGTPEEAKPRLALKGYDPDSRRDVMTLAHLTRD